ncbi:MAG: HAMP domain-containing protein [Bryobacterales bacterium]|nr:HAMP domain-containing protein [Bryobacterales bacterium]
MTFRTRLLLISSLTVSGAVALVTGAVSIATRRAFERMDQDRRNALLGQFRRELAQRGDDVIQRVKRVAASEQLLRIAIESAHRDPDFAPFLNEAQQQAEAQSLDFLDIVRPDRSIISSAHWPARFGYQNNWLIDPADWNTEEAFLTRIPLEEGSAVALAAIRASTAGDQKIYVLGARKLDRAFLDSLAPAPGMRALLWLSPREVMDASGPVAEVEKLAPLVEQVRAGGQQTAAIVQWTPQPSSAESLVALPLARHNTLLGVLLAGSSLAEQVWLERWILYTGIFVGGSGILLGVLLGWWATERVTRPVEQLAEGARSLAAGDWSVRAAVNSSDEIGDLARTFNQMTAQLLEQRERAVQAERVAAWRELARRLAHELKNPLFPLQITVENLQRARANDSREFDEIFAESTSALLTELANLKTIIGRFSDFARMPPPQSETVDANTIVTAVMKLFDAQFHAEGRPHIEPVLELAPSPLLLEADPEQLRRALHNLVLNAMDAMPDGGTLRIRTDGHDSLVRIQVADSGQGLTAEECARLFTPYYTTKRHGTGLGLAIVQSVVSDHQGKISVSSEPGHGATFTIDLPERRNA